MSQRQNDYNAEGFTSSPEEYNIDSIPPTRPSQPPGNNAPFRATQIDQKTPNQFKPSGSSAQQKRPTETGYTPQTRPENFNTRGVSPALTTQENALNLNKRRPTQPEPFDSNVQYQQPVQTEFNPQANMQNRGNDQLGLEQPGATGYEHLFIHISEQALVDPELVQLVAESPRSRRTEETQFPRAQANFNQQDQTRHVDRPRQVQSVRDTTNFKVWQDKDGTTYYYSEEWYQNDDAVGHIRTRIREQQSPNQMQQRQSQSVRTLPAQDRIESSRQVQFERPGGRTYNETNNGLPQTNSAYRSPQRNPAYKPPESSYHGHPQGIIHDCPGCDLADYRFAQEHLTQDQFVRTPFTGEYSSPGQIGDPLRQNIGSPSQQGHFVGSSGQGNIQGASEQSQYRTIPSDPGQFRTTTGDAYGGQYGRPGFNDAGSRGRPGIHDEGSRGRPGFTEGLSGQNHIICPECRSGRGRHGFTEDPSGLICPECHSGSRPDYNNGVSSIQGGFLGPGGQQDHIYGGPRSYNAQGPAQSQFGGSPINNTGIPTQQGPFIGPSGPSQNRTPPTDQFRTTTGDAYGYGA